MLLGGGGDLLQSRVTFILKNDALWLVKTFHMESRVSGARSNEFTSTMSLTALCMLPMFWDKGDSYRMQDNAS